MPSDDHRAPPERDLAADTHSRTESGLVEAASVFWRALVAEGLHLGRRTWALTKHVGRWISREWASAQKFVLQRAQSWQPKRKARQNATADATPTGLEEKPRARRFFLKPLLVTAALVALVASILVASVTIWAIRGMPLADILPALEEAHLAIVTADGDTLHSRGAYRSGYVALQDLPESLANAAIAVEDKRFQRHAGIDFRGISRAAILNLRRGGVSQGGSTISQQLIKILYLGPERTLRRKLQEMILAIALEDQLGKDRILELYLNSVYLGAGAWGAPAAAEVYFGTPVEEITLAQSAVLAAAIRSPSRDNPVADPDASRERAGLVLRLMAEQGLVTDAELEPAMAELATLVATPPPSRAGGYYVDWILAEAADLSDIVEGSLSVTATLDPILQAAAEQVVTDIMNGAGRTAGATQAAVVAMTPDGHVRAMVGGVDYSESQFNRATHALRQPGSTFKLPVYLAALVMGLDPDSVILDAPIEIDGWSPQNYGGRFNGNVTLTQAFASSLNAATVRLADTIGIENVIAVAHQLGIEGPLTETPSLALGTSEVTLLDMTEAYASILAGRLPVRATGIASLTVGEGSKVLTLQSSAPDAVEMTHSRPPMMEMLQAVVTSGTGQGAQLDGFSAGKTGTSQENRDAWFIGFSEALVIGVWVGNDDASPMTGVTGGGIPVDIWRGVMQAAQTSAPGQSAAQIPPGSFSVPLTNSAAPAQCNVRACARAYRSFRQSDCSFQPYRGQRQLCTR